MRRAKQFIKLFEPPLFLLIRIHLRRLFGKLIGDKIVDGYSNQDFLKHYLSRGEAFVSQLNAGRTLMVSEVTPAFGLMLFKASSSLTILDFGGGTGNQFHIMKTLFPETELNWNIVETPELVHQIYQQLQSDTMIVGNSSLSFSSCLADFSFEKKKIDIIIAAGSLQYISDPYSKLIELINFEARTVHISRMPLTHQEELLVFNQISRLDDNGPQGESASSNSRVSNTVYIPNLKKFETIISLKYSHVITLIESLDGYPDSKHRVPLYSIIAYN